PSWPRDWSSDVCSSDLLLHVVVGDQHADAGVDPIAVHDIQTIVAGLRHRGIGVLITDHNVEQTLDIVDRAYIMFEGKVQVAGTRSEERRVGKECRIGAT